MIDQIPSNEKAVERNPNEREVFNKFEDILGDRDFEELGKVEDEEGLYSWDIQTKDETGDRMDIGYARAKVLTDGTKRPAKIHQTLYFEGIPCGSGAQYDHIEGQWVEKS